MTTNELNKIIQLENEKKDLLATVKKLKLREVFILFSFIKNFSLSNVKTTEVRPFFGPEWAGQRRVQNQFESF